MKKLTAVSLATVLTASPALADEGMWTFDAFPAARMKAAYGWAPDKAWLDRAQAAAVRLTGGCSASFVSGEGLILTNHHCIAQCAQDLSSKDTDYLANGFVAADRARELKCPGQQAEVVTAITDVTPRVMKAIGTLTGEALTKARDAAIATIEAEACTDKETTRCQVVTLYGGGEYKLYRYRKYSDVRLVWAPEFAAAFFGGDPDNFNFPRYALDASFLRAYENGKPAATPQHLTWNPRAPIEGEATFVVGNPGRTQRLLTQDQLAFQRQFTLPLMTTLLSEMRGRLIAASEQSPDRRREAADTLFGIENSYKVYWGQARALDDAGFAGKLKANEADLKAKAGKRLGDPWGDIARATDAYRDIALDHFFLEQRAGMFSTLYGYARTIVRAAAEREKPNAERLPGYTDSALPLLGKQLTDATPTYPWLEETALSFWLSKTREYLGADSPQVKALLGRDSPEQLADRLVTGTKLADPAARKALFDGGMAAVRASKDPLIQFVLRNDPAARALRTAYAQKVDAPVTAAQAKLARARFAAYGAGNYPDATFTLRISYGKVDGWMERGAKVPYRTTLAGLYERATGQEPFVLAKGYAAAKARLDMATTFDFVTTNDIIGGNSGSPVIAKDGSVIGAAFDGNIHSLGGNFGYDPVLNRTVVVSTQAVQQALEKVYPAPALVRELAAR
ncbi:MULTISPECIES: S46 family peptidase [Sphingomonas]|uniref:Dipeptidyl-peptidase n=1 Tax=Sphingomonas adhaesiva TaxID=28212 RepID=A0A2A4I8R2_9SPHN|nr:MULTISPECIES: S46 family peptidase [Sphingomonas]PCG14394.1 peptidase [Sphingomonas adhaesiva]PZU80954.1 MAG: S46 family peptidase [Sphingomonas sp.]